MKKYLLVTIWMVMFVPLTGSTTETNGRENELYKEASALMQSAIEETGNFSKSLEFYQSAREMIEEINTEYSTSDIAARLVSGQAKISGFSLKEFQELGGSLQTLASAERDPLSYALYIATIIDADNKSYFLFKIVDAYVETGQLPKAIKIANTIENPLLKVRSLISIASNYIETGQQEDAYPLLSQALETSKGIDSYSKADQLVAIASKYIETGKKKKASQTLSQALKAVNTIKYEFFKASALAKIASNYAEMGEFTKALKIANSIDKDYGHDKADALATIAGKYIETGQKKKAFKILSNALKAVKSDNINYSTSGLIGNKNVYIKIADKYAEGGQNKKAANILSRAVKVALNEKPYFEFKENGVLAAMAEKYAENGQKKKAIQILSQSLKATIDAPFLSVIGLADIAGKYAEFGEEKKATEILSLATETAKKIKRDKSDTNDYKSIALSMISRKYAEIGKFPEALDVASTIEDASSKDDALVAIAKNYGKFEQFTDALAIIKMIKGVSSKTRVLVTVSGQYSESQQEPDEKSLAALHDIAHTAVFTVKTGPFGLQWGASAEEISALGVLLKKEDSSDNKFSIYSTKKLPKSLSIAERYTLLFDKGYQLQKMLISSKDIDNDLYGNEGKETYSSIKAQLREKYGRPIIEIEKSGDVLYKKEDEFYQCLIYTGCGHWVSVFESISDNSTISIELNGLERGKGYISLTYEGPLWSKIVDETKSNDSKSDADAL